MSTLQEETITLECRAGHTWTVERPGRGRWPEYCLTHKRFFLEQLSGRLRPPMDVRQEWLEQGKMLDDENYSKRWEKLWVKTVRMVGARGNSWNTVDVDKVRRYVRAVRMAELHRLYAQDEPYTKTTHGFKPHPGFELAKEADIEARACAVELGLVKNEEVTNNARVVPSKKEPRERKMSADYFNSRLQGEAEELGEVLDATGPDGEAL